VAPEKMVMAAAASANGLGVSIPATFARFDRNGDHGIDVGELHEALQSIGLRPDSRDATLQVMRQYDKDGDGYLQLSEFTVLVQRARRQLLEPLDVFRFFDKNRNGSIDLDELYHALDALGLVASIDDAKAVMIKFKHVSTATLDQHEFCKVLDRARTFQRNCASFERFDADNNGRINSTELHKALKANGLRPTPGLADEIMERFAQASQQTQLSLHGYLQLVDAMATFRSHDLDDNGVVDGHELHQALRELGVATSPNQTQQVMRLFDLDNSHKLDLNEFLLLVDYIKVFREIDSDKDGCINVEELAMALPMLGFTLDGRAMEDAYAVMAQYDRDANDSLQLVEFLYLSKAVKEKQQRKTPSVEPSLLSALGQKRRVASP